MRRLKIIGLLSLLAGISYALVRISSQPFLSGGIQVNEPDHASWVGALAHSGFNTVALTVYARQGDWDSANLWFEEEEPWVVGEAVVAKSQGLHVVLVLRIALDHAFERNKFFWHGMIMPTSDAEVAEWFDRYEQFVLKWVRIAADVGIDVVAIGSELNALTNTVRRDDIPPLEEYWSNDEKVARENARLLAHREEIADRPIWVRGHESYEELAPFLDDRSAAHAEWARGISYAQEEQPVERINERRRLLDAHWRRLIGKSRRVYSGRLTYAANFDQYREVSFWDELDLIGINAYFPLRRRELPDASDGRVALFKARWSTILHEIDALRRERGIGDHRVLFTELGYVRRANSTIQPWAANGFSVVPGADGPRLLIWEEQPEDPRERAQAVRGLYEANLQFGGSMLAGLLYWKLSTEPAHLEVEPFVLLVGQTAAEDPLLREMRRFTSSLQVDLWKRRLRSPLRALRGAA